MTALEQSRGKQAELTLEAVVGKSRKMRELYYFVRSISDSLSNVLIRGETGVGKGLIAKLIHFYSINRNGPFIHVNCSAIPESLLESELFGHTKGAFTGAINDRKGRFELANNGTLFLDEIGDLSLAMQTKLLRVVEDKKFEKLGSNTPIESNVRIIAATNKNIEEAVLKGTFRADLYYRLNIIPIFIPPLRDRMEDLPLLINHFIDKLNNQYNKDPKIRSVSCYAFDVLSKYSWPGNIRELENVLEYAFIHCKDSQLDTQHLPINLLGVKIEKINNKFMKGVSAELVEKQRLTEALDKCRWNRKNTAKFLNLSRPTLWRKIKKYQLLSQGPIN
jgi:transcriptional regulator with PAS, ATPase and Fis domain